MEHDPIPPALSPELIPTPLGVAGMAGVATEVAGLASEIAARLDRPLVLVGMMGVGKTSLGRKLATALDLPFTDADDAIEAAAMRSIPEIFAAHGEAYFRDGERRVIARLIGGNATGASVIATGGGAFCNAQTRALILARGIAIWLDADLDTLVDRTARRGNRPLLANGDARATLAGLKTARESDYAQAPIHVHSGSGPHRQTLTQLLRAIILHLDNAPCG